MVKRSSISGKETDLASVEIAHYTGMNKGQAKFMSKLAVNKKCTDPEWDTVTPVVKKTIYVSEVEDRTPAELGTEWKFYEKTMNVVQQDSGSATGKPVVNGNETSYEGSPQSVTGDPSLGEHSPATLKNMIDNLWSDLRQHRWLFYITTFLATAAFAGVVYLTWFR